MDTYTDSISITGRSRTASLSSLTFCKPNISATKQPLFRWLFFLCRGDVGSALGASGLSLRIEGCFTEHAGYHNAPSLREDTRYGPLCQVDGIRISSAQDRGIPRIGRIVSRNNLIPAKKEYVAYDCSRGRR